MTNIPNLLHQKWVPVDYVEVFCKGQESADEYDGKAYLLLGQVLECHADQLSYYIRVREVSTVLATTIEVFEYPRHHVNRFHAKISRVELKKP